MRIGVVFEPNSNANYRAVDPMKAMERRGHEIVWPRDKEGRADPRLLSRCDVVHVYRRAADDTRRILGDLARAGIAITYDNDDDFTTIPKESPAYKEAGGLIGRKVFTMTVKAAKQARCFTTTTDELAERYEHEGFVPFSQLPGRIGGWDVAIAPLADIPANQTRSDIKLKEYAGCGIPWLASPVGPYAALGEDQGGRLVPDDGWYEALDRLVTSKRDRKRLGKKAKKWAKRQTIS